MESTKLNISILALFISLITLVGCTKNRVIQKIKKLPGISKEISGITLFPSQEYLYTINDSGNDNTVIIFTSEGDFIDEFVIPGTTNIDWEDISYDHYNNLYIGDFGNNDNDRKDLVIYKVSDPLKGKSTVSEIKFSLEDQLKFPPKKKNRNFDIEACIYLDGNLYLFTKNRSSHFDGTTKLYTVPAIPGTHTAQLVATFKTCEYSNRCFITAAAVNHAQNKIVLLTYDMIFVLTDFKLPNVFNGSIQTKELNHFSQKEGVTFLNDTTLLVTDEKNGKNTGFLYKVEL
ncbi:hypothetical protein HN014_20720 [Aquimarina sp. TRL1]|uniref:SdiA-regulated domain-containing protein n=1 Tax=Aquimarina sp. (strain TRL1) TaxID=2736252 RepID=UPI00158E5E34|nr:SdiA-regulated domain-containing protein [Aquimarina sp. TRL1]QKX07230.1 hypothetical protein HN014_20720 [Aquimarina sp. TRL1]